MVTLVSGEAVALSFGIPVRTSRWPRQLEGGRFTRQRGSFGGSGLVLWTGGLQQHVHVSPMTQMTGMVSYNVDWNEQF